MNGLSYVVVMRLVQDVGLDFLFRGLTGEELAQFFGNGQADLIEEWFSEQSVKFVYGLA